MNDIKEWLTAAGTFVAVLASSYALYRAMVTSRREAKKQVADEAAAKKKAEEEAALKEQARLDAIAEQERMLSEHGLTLEQFRQQVARELLEDLREQVASAAARAARAEERADAADERMDGMGRELRALRSSYAKAERQIGEMFDHLDAVEVQLTTPVPRPAHWVHFDVA